MCQRMGARAVWALSNFTVFACMAGTAVISLMSLRDNSEGNEHILPNETTRTAAVIVFALLGFPLAVSFVLTKPSSFFFFAATFLCDDKTIFFYVVQITYSVPFSVTAEVTADSGGGQGL